jgi:DNA-binding transcriptional ArsR family regulator
MLQSPALSTSLLDATFAALADPTRRAILRRLRAGEANVNELVAPFRLSQPTLSKHLKVLIKAGLVEQRREGPFRPCRLNAPRLEEAWLWIGDYRRFWEASFDRLDDYANELLAQEQPQKREKPRAHKSSRRR